MDGLASQLPHYLGDVVLLKKPDRRNASGTRINTGASVAERDAAQRKNGNLLPASFTQSIQASRDGLRDILLSENWGEHSIVSPCGRGTRNVRRGMARNTDEDTLRMFRTPPNFPYFRRRNIVRPQMHSVSSARQGNIAP